MIRILWVCWQRRQPYDETRYLKQLLHRKKSPTPCPPDHASFIQNTP